MFQARIDGASRLSGSISSIVMPDAFRDELLIPSFNGEGVGSTREEYDVVLKLKE